MAPTRTATRCLTRSDSALILPPGGTHTRMATGSAGSRFRPVGLFGATPLNEINRAISLGRQIAFTARQGARPYTAGTNPWPAPTLGSFTLDSDDGNSTSSSEEQNERYDQRNRKGRREQVDVAGRLHRRSR